MYTTILTVMLTSAGMASTAQGPYGGMGGYNGEPGTYAGSGWRVGGYSPYGGGYYPQYQAVPWGRGEDPRCAELEKKVDDLTALLRNLSNKVKENEVRLEVLNNMDQLQKQMAQMAESNKDLYEKLMVAIAKVNNEGIDRKIADAVKREINEVKGVAPAVLVDGDVKKISELELKVRTLEAGKQEAANTTAVLVKLLEVMQAKQGDPALAQMMEMIKHQSDKLERFFTSNGAKIQFKPGTDLTRALIIVNLPADAKLMVDTFPSTIGTNVRSFISPELEAGKTYFYNLHVEVTRNNKIYVSDQKVFFQPGREVHVNFENIEPAAVNSPITNNPKQE